MVQLVCLLEFLHPPLGARSSIFHPPSPETVTISLSRTGRQKQMHFSPEAVRLSPETIHIFSETIFLLFNKHQRDRQLSPRIEP